MRSLLRRIRSRTRPPVPDVVLVDGRNVQRSTWPNPTLGELLDALAEWAAVSAPRERVVVVLDGPLDVEPPGSITVVEVGYADDELVAQARAAIAAGSGVRAATSDRDLRERLEEAGAEVPWGGGRFLRELGLAGRRRR